jgi:hypothetical protein
VTAALHEFEYHRDVPRTWFHWCPAHPVTLVLRECDCCGSPRKVGRSHGRLLCSNCNWRWRYHGFRPGGPGPLVKPPVATQIEEYADVITSLSARRAAEKLGVSSRTVHRWRAALRVTS